jgi:hypothetical protein
VEVVRSGIDAWNRGDMPAFEELMHPDHAEAIEAVGLSE